jgi:hypothetical protein
VCVVAAAGTAIGAAIVLTLMDVFLIGQGLGSITGPLLDWPSVGVHMSAADLTLVAASAAAVVISWRATEVRR